MPEWASNMNAMEDSLGVLQSCLLKIRLIAIVSVENGLLSRPKFLPLICSSVNNVSTHR